MGDALASRPALDPLFDEAHRRARRRRIALATGVAVAAVATVVLWPSSHRSEVPHPEAPRPAAIPTVRPKRVVKDVYMGVSCRTPNRLGCDRMGLAIWTKHPARSIRATIGARSFALDDRQWSGPARHGLRRMFAGFLQPAGFQGDGPLAVEPDGPGGQWEGEHPTDPRVRLVITRADGSRRATTLRISLSPGWG